MKLRTLLFLMSVCVAFAQTANFSGVWKANLEKSKFASPQVPTSYLLIIDQQGTVLKETAGLTSQRGEQRMAYTYDLGSKPSINEVGGLPVRTNVAVDGSSVKLNSETAGPHARTSIDTYVLSPDGNTLTLSQSMTADGQTREQMIVFEKQPDSAGDALRKPEVTAGEKYKNLQILKQVPASQFIDIMRSFTVALGANCTLCHVEGNFASDDKHEKAMARKMLTMVHGINEQYFGGHPEVHCFTCHKGQNEPQSRPAFASGM